jgi:hypothetical protein
LSQGIFGVVDFRNGLDDPKGLAGTLGGFLQRNGSGGNAVSTEQGRNFILGMKRLPNGASNRQTGIGRDR